MKFTEDDVLEAVFLIEAIGEDDFQEKKHEIGELSHFCRSFNERFEEDEDEDGGMFKIIDFSTQYKSLKELKKDIANLREKNWYIQSETIYFNGKEIISDGRWLI